MTHEEAFALSPIKVGQRYRFDYPGFLTSLPEYTEHAGRTVTVLRPCTDDEADVIWDTPDDSDNEVIVDRMFKVQAADGWIGDAWESELVEL